jgi:nicotinic acid mononucleotide adenylyltransferase
VRHGRSIRYRTPRAVEKYIETHALYRSDERPPG